MMYPEDIIIAPILTEKTNGARKFHKYTFKVAKKANKIQVKEAIQKIYNVKVLSCNTVNMDGKKKRQGRFIGKTSSYKKATVTLKKGDTISIFEGT